MCRADKNWHFSLVCLPAAAHFVAHRLSGATIKVALYAMCRAGIDLATVEVRMDKLKVEANIAVGSRGNPTVTNTLLNMAEVHCFQTQSHRSSSLACINQFRHVVICIKSVLSSVLPAWPDSLHTFST